MENRSRATLIHDSNHHMRLNYTIVKRDDFQECEIRLSNLENEIASSVERIRRIKSGELKSIEYDGDSELLRELEEMRKQMLKLSEEEQRRNWSNVGIARFAELIRIHQNDTGGELYQKVISSLVSYMGANQGQIYVIPEQDNPVLELVSCYAYDKRKYVTSRIEPGEGLVGQCYLERNIIYMTRVPENYVRITSGLGEALPRCILLVPLKTNAEVVGVIELAFFDTLSDYQISFIEKIAENLASAVVSIRITEKTHELLRESQEQAEQLKAQEEEMRQNMEELAASQEEMLRLQLEAETQNRIFNSMAIVSRTDVRGNIIYVNDEFVRWSKYSKEELMGQNHRILKSGHQPDEIFAELWTTISGGKIWRGEVKNRAKDGSYYWVDAIIAPVMDHNGNPREYISQRFVINDKKEREEQMNALLEESRAQGEELRRIGMESEAQTKIINSLAIVSKTNIRGEITYVNDEFVRWSGYTREELIGKNHRLLKSGHQPDEIFQKLWATISSGRIWRGEVKNRCKDGSYYWVDAIIAPVLDEHGKPQEYIAQRFVINEKKEKEEQMQALLEDTRAKEEELRQNMEEMNAQQEVLQRVTSEIEAQMNIINSVAIVSKTDVRGNITYVNDEFIKWSGYDKTELIGHNHRILKSGHQPDEVFSDLWSTISGGMIWRGKVKNKAKNGTFYWVDAIIAPVLDVNGKPKEYIAQRFVLDDEDVRRVEA